jgi:hypothetical protein
VLTSKLFLFVAQIVKVKWNESFSRKTLKETVMMLQGAIDLESWADSHIKLIYLAAMYQWKIFRRLPIDPLEVKDSWRRHETASSLEEIVVVILYILIGFRS